MYTRQEYMRKEVSHSDYYSQFVNKGILEYVRSAISEQRIKASVDPHFNDIVLSSWDNLHFFIKMYCRKAVSTANGNGGYSISDSVCIAKQVARMIKEKL